MNPVSARERVVVVGAGMVGHRFVDELVRRDAGGRFEVIHVGAEAYPSYNRILLSEVLAGRADLRAIELPAPPPGVDVRRSATVTVAYLDRGVVVVEGEELAFDRLVLATGATAFVPPFAGLEQRPRNVHVLRDLDDCRDLAGRALTAKSAVVVGGGVLGLEAACGLRNRGVPVTVVDLDQHLVARQLDAAPAEALAGQLADLGIDVRLGLSVQEVIGAYDELVAVRLTDQSVLACDLLLVSCGIRPATELADGAGLAVGRGITVDDHLVTSDPRVFAIGDCAEPPSGVTGLLAPGWRQAEALAEAFVSDLPAVVELPEREGLRLKAVGADLVTAGVRDRGRVVTVHDPAGRRHVELVVDDDLLVGYTCVGAPDVAASLAVAHERATPVPTDPLALLLPAGGRGEEATPVRMPGSTTVCRCNSVTKKQIVRAWEDGATTVDAVAASTRATTGCGGCSSVVCGLVDWLNESDPATSGTRNTDVTQGPTRVTTDA